MDVNDIKYFVEIANPDGSHSSFLMSKDKLDSMIARRVELFFGKPNCSVDLGDDYLNLRKNSEYTTITWINAEYV